MPSSRQTGILLGDSIRHALGADVMDDPIPCPQCGGPARITERFWLASTDGPVEHLVTGCSHQHWLTPRAETLAGAQPNATPAATQRPLARAMADGASPEPDLRLPSGGTRMRPIGKHAVVLGASMAGLATARVLADTYERVTVLERDTLPAAAAHRKGVPQSRHAHALLAAGRDALEELFGGLTDELVANGALSGGLAETRVYNEGLRLCLEPDDLQGQAIVLSRPLLEGCVRERVRALPNVQVVDRCEATGLVGTPDGRAVRGVRAIRRADGHAEEVLEADLVVDATGRGSRSPIWLEELGYPRPAQDEVRTGLAYASRIYRRRPDHLDGDLVVVVAATVDRPRGGAMLAMEGDRWIVTLNSYLGQRPPTDPDGFAAFAAALPAPDIFEVISDAEPLGEALPARYPVSVRRRYERLRRFPDGYLVTGDAVCAFNPVYGQGMSVAALEALALRECLRAGPAGLAGRFFAKVSRIVDIPWGIAVGADLRLPGVQGARTAKVRLINAYLARFHVAAATDPVLGGAFVRVGNLMDRPERLLRPTIALRVLRGNLRRAATRSHESRPASRTQPVAGGIARVEPAPNPAQRP
jgi:2-polyprenyl-6-methoxyphenol hydroxylase-like FAD-dependent oxidoreductase